MTAEMCVIPQRVFFNNKVTLECDMSKGKYAFSDL